MTGPFPAFGDLVPHAPPMVLLDELVTWEPGRAECRMTLREGAPFVVEGAVDTLVCVEYMAQAVAACLGYEAFRGGIGVRVGMIVASRRVVLHEPRIEVGTALRIDVTRVRGDEVLSHFDGRVSSGDREIASAQLTLFHAESMPR